MAEQSAEEYRTEQERFWAGTFGSDYIERNRTVRCDAVEGFMQPHNVQS